MQPLLALADEVPNYKAIALSPGVGWILLAAVVCLALFFIAHRESWQKLWLRVDDPRPMAAMRIAFGICALCNINGLWELFGYLFTDEGIFTTDIAQHYRARSQFAGFGDGTAETEPWGFFSFAAFLEWLKGPNYSLLLFNSSPKFFWSYLVVFEVVMLMLIVGFKTQWTKWIGWFLFMGIILRNTLFWEATENVYQVFFFYLCLSRCGEAWSVDNWLRCRKLRKQGRLSTPGGPGGGAGALVEVEGEAKPRLLEPIYRPIPGWPRLFVVLNVAVLYCATGSLKNGPRWTQGNAFYYAFNLDHFYRLPPQQLSSYFGTNLFRLMTWVTHWWEALFPLLVLGLILRWRRREKIAPLQGWKLWLARSGLGGFALFFYVLILYSYPVHYRSPEGGLVLFRRLPKVFHVLIAEDRAIPTIQWIVGITLPIAAVLIVLGYRWLRDRQDIPRDQRGPLKSLDLDWVCRWLLGRRMWLMLGLIFHGHLILTMNIGWFSPGLLACYFTFLNGDELGFISTKIGQGFHKAIKLPVPAHVRAGQAVPSADLTLPRFASVGVGRRRWVRRDAHVARRDGYAQPWAVVFTGFALAVLAVLRRIQTDEDMWARLGKLSDKAGAELPAGLLAQPHELAPNWFVAMIAVMALVVMAQRTRGLEFNPYFGFVIVLTAWVGSVLAERELVAMIWVVGAVAVVSFLACRKPASAPAPMPVRDPETDRVNRPWAYGPLGRSVVVIFIAYHLCAVATTQFPDKDSWWTFRRDTSGSFSDYLQATHTTQGWGMFAPNPPTQNVFLRVTVTDQKGDVYDLNTDVYACFMPGATPEVCDAIYPIPWVWYTRQRKMNRRIAGSEGGNGSWYQKWHARYVCREWQLSHGGELPKSVELFKITYPIPAPEKVKGKPYDPKQQYNRFGHPTSLYTTDCKSTVLGQLSNEVRKRHGMDETTDKLPVWNKRRCAKWEAKLIEDARAEAKKAGKGEEVDVLDPRFDVCPDTPKEVRKARYEQGQDDLLTDHDDDEDG
jgi:uncharacterized membrane protein YphA (DoxX/SURF4 family)